MANMFNSSFDIITTLPGNAAGHYYNDCSINVPDYADGWYIRKAKDTHNNVREMLIDMKLRRNRLNGVSQTELQLHRPLDTGFHVPELDTLPHLDYKHKKGKFEHLYRKKII